MGVRVSQKIKGSSILSEAIEVRRNCVRGLIGTPKSGKVRRVDMSAGLKAVLQAYLTKRKRDILKKGWGESLQWLFYNGSGNAVDVNNIRERVFKKVLQKAGLRHIRMHDLRHTYATLRIDAGHNIADVSKQLGHHSIRITIDTYHHWMPGSAKAEVDQLDLEAVPNCTLCVPSDQTGDNDINVTV